MGVTDDPHDGCLHEIDPDTKMQKCYLVLPDNLRKDLVRPVRRSYIHLKCGFVTYVGQKLAETYAANPFFYGGTYCVHCKDHFRVGELGEFNWVDARGYDTGIKVGT